MMQNLRIVQESNLVNLSVQSPPPRSAAAAPRCCGGSPHTRGPRLGHVHLPGAPPPRRAGDGGSGGARRQWGGDGRVGEDH